MVNKNLWAKILNKFRKTSAPYLIVGGAAMVLHGIPRSTLDIDIYIPAEKPSLKWLFSFWNKHGLKCSQKDLRRLAKTPELLIGQWVTFSTKEGIDILDIFIENKDDFYKLYDKAIKTKNLNIVSLEDLLVLKENSGRNIDYADIELIKKWKK